jgi:hypothetical protein
MYLSDKALAKHARQVVLGFIPSTARKQTKRMSFEAEDQLNYVSVKICGERGRC